MKILLFFKKINSTIGSILLNDKFYILKSYHNHVSKYTLLIFTSLSLLKVYSQIML